MYERFTDRARKVIRLASDEALCNGSVSLTPQHILLGLLKEGNGVAAHAIQRLKPDIQSIRAALAERIAADAVAQPSGEVAVTPPSRTAWRRILGAVRNWVALNDMPLSTEAKRIIEQARCEARALRHNYIGTEHLLLGLFGEPDYPATRLLSAHGLQGDHVRREVLNLLNPMR